jgi:hypothetical protein
VSDLEGLGVVAKEIYANWNGSSTTSPSLGSASDTTHGFTPWEAFNGNVSGSAEGYASTAYVSKDRPGSIGWFDSQGSQGPTIINSFKIDALQDKLPTVFDLYGYNSETQVWEFVQGYDISATYVDETSHTFEVDTFRAYSGFRLDIFAPSQIDAQTGTIDYPNPQDASEALNPDVVITELTFEVNSSDVLVNSGLNGIDDAETLYRVLDAINSQTATAASNTDSLAKVKVIAQGVFEAIALENIVEYLDDQQLTPPTGVAAPTVDDFTTLGITTFGSGSFEETITNDNIGTVLADLVTMGSSIDTTNGGTASVQGIDKTELKVALDRINVPVDFLGVDINEDGDYADDYEVAVNGVVGFDDSDSTTGDSAFDLYLDVSDASNGDIIELYVDGELLYTSSALTASDISNGTYVVDSANLDLSSKDTTGAAGSNAVAGDDRVELELKVKLSDNSYVQEDTSWEYHW